MTDAAAQLVGFVGPWLGAAFVVFLRIGAIASVFPGIGEHSVPVRVRLVLALALTAIVLPVVGPEIRVAAREPAFIAACLATESAIGLAFGIVFRLLVNALETAGAMIAQSASLSQLFGAGGEPMPAISHLLVAGGLALAVASGLHLRLVTLLIESYTLFPAGAVPVAGDFARWGIAGVARAFSLAFGLAAPFVIAALVYNLAIGVINKAMPQLMVSFIGTPALIGGSLLLLSIAAPIALHAWRGALFGLLADPFGGAP